MHQPGDDAHAETASGRMLCGWVVPTCSCPNIAACMHACAPISRRGVCTPIQATQCPPPKRDVTARETTHLRADFLHNAHVLMAQDVTGLHGTPRQTGRRPCSAVLTVTTTGAWMLVCMCNATSCAPLFKHTCPLVRLFAPPTHLHPRHAAQVDMQVTAADGRARHTDDGVILQAASAARTQSNERQRRRRRRRRRFSGKAAL